MSNVYSGKIHLWCLSSGGGLLSGGTWLYQPETYCNVAYYYRCRWWTIEREVIGKQSVSAGTVSEANSQRQSTKWNNNLAPKLTLRSIIFTHFFFVYEHISINISHVFYKTKAERQETNFQKTDTNISLYLDSWNWNLSEHKRKQKSERKQELPMRKCHPLQCWTQD